ncbi:Fc.00g094610.m01.CDS01 [Cosmosporella sp. VM-42]
MPPRKRGGNDADSFNAQTAPAPAKRQRVSLACDACRTAREKCDGDRPVCGTCTAQDRNCSYTPASRKRGVQTGYLRTIELSLAWLFEQVPECEGALHRLLTQNEGADGARILGPKEKAGHRLYRRWNKSRVHKDIGRFLSDEKTHRTDTSPDDTDTEEDPSPTNSNLFDAKQTPDFSIHGLGLSQQDTPSNSYSLRPRSSQSISRLTLPSNWQRLIDIYFSYTHCWLPIVERDTITGTALTYPPEGLSTSSSTSISASHAQLWAVLAVAAFQDSASSEPSSNGTLSPARIYSVARRLIPPDDGKFEAPHTCALLLQALVLLGQKKNMAAWLLIGKASRLALNDRDTTTHMYPTRPELEDSPSDHKSRILAASFMLDTLVSLCLGHTPLTTDAGHNLPTFNMADFIEIDETWAPIFGFGASFGTLDPSLFSSTQSVPTFHQLYAFCKLWGANMDSRLHDCSTRQRITPEGLVKGLDPRFSFCNSLIFGGSTPIVPSAFLLQGMFLTITLDLVPGYRTSLFSNLMEVIESCIENFGPCGTPPIMVTLMEIVYRHGHIDRMHDHDKAKWKTAVDSLHAVWNAEPSEMGGFEGHQITDIHQDAMNHPIMGSTFMDEISTATYRQNQGASSISGASDRQGLSRLHQPKEQARLSYDRQRYAINPDGSPCTSHVMHAVTPNLSFQSPAMSGGHTVPILQDPGIQGQLVDYDTILEELGSIDCADSIDVDPQFMANLGFAPGCDLGEMFQGDFGI